MINPTYTQPETVAKEHCNPTLVTYEAALQAAAENGPEVINVAPTRQSKRNCIIIFNALDSNNLKMNASSYPERLEIITFKIIILEFGYED